MTYSSTNHHSEASFPFTNGKKQQHHRLQQSGRNDAQNRMNVQSERERERETEGESVYEYERHTVESRDEHKI